jgi:DNA adenine methylase
LKPVSHESGENPKRRNILNLIQHYTLRTPVTYYGGKQQLAPTILDLAPHDLEKWDYCEPFIGGGAVFWAKKPSRLEAINDIDGRVINFYEVTQNPRQFPKLFKMINTTLHAETYLHQARDFHYDRIPAGKIEKAWAFWVATNMSFGGNIYGGWKWCNGTSGSHSGISIRNKRLQFTEAIHARLQDVQISKRDALKVITDRDSIKTFFYLDPPYPGCVQGHYSGYTVMDLFNLLDLIKDIKGKFILSNFWTQTLSYHINKYGWNYESITSQMKVANLGNRGQRPQGKKEKTEILTMNYNPKEISKPKHEQKLLAI